MPGKASFDAIVVGAGLVGLSLTLALLRQGWQVLLVDKRSAPVKPDSKPVSVSGFQLDSGFSARVSALNSRSLTLLNELGIDATWLEQHSALFQGMHVWDGDGTAGIEFNASGRIVENHRLEWALLLQISHLGLTPVWQSEISDIECLADEVRIRFSTGEEFLGNCLMGVDGAYSDTRERVGIRVIEWSYEQTSMTTTVQTTLPHTGIARQCFTRDGPLALLPLADPQLCSLVWSGRNTVDRMALSDEMLCQEISRESEFVLGQVTAVDSRFEFPLRQAHAVHYAKNNVVLLGDAAHSIHPLAGQGVNLGFADVHSLVSALAVLKLTPTRSLAKIFEKYQRQQRPRNLLMTATMESLKRLFDTDHSFVRWARNTGMDWLDGQDLIKAQLERVASGL
ncbi:MAG: FAD-dependent monooxygenase [Pseudomonadota bacterium]|nr:FAD-dependent monooxygenase [Pseudomonadota bacterium]